MYRIFICVSVACLLFCVPPAEAKDYAVLISAGQATTDDAAVNSCFWYNPYLQYKALLDEGYGDDDIYFLYGFGTDFASAYPCYQPPYPVTDYPVNRANIESVFNMLGGIMTSSDFLYVWWMGHGGPSGSNLVMNIGTTGESVWDYEMADWVGQITNYDLRTFSWMTCYSGGILDDLEGLRSIVMSSATFYESTYDQWLCDTYHAEFHYPERCAWAWETPCGICGPVDADGNGNGRVSFAEAFTYAYNNTSLSTPQISDLGGLAPDTYLGGCVTNEDCDDGNECTDDACVDGVCENTPVADNTPCTGGLCCGGICTTPTCTNHGDCDDGEACTTDTCLNGGTCAASCENTWPPCGLADGCCGPTCTPATDPDCVGCDDDGTCEQGEDCHNCPNDCISGGGGYCADGICDPDLGEDCHNCPEDCNGKLNGALKNQFCCGDDVDCSDSRCQVEPYMCGPSPPPYCCGDGVCEGAENVSNCAIDCGCSSPADCDDGEECTFDDCVEGACQNTPLADNTPCTDGICCDGTCDAAVCYADADCDDGDVCTIIDACYNGGTCSAYCDSMWAPCGLADGCCGPACTPDTDPDCLCLPSGEPCTSDSECCSNKCLGKPGSRTCK